MRGYMLVSALLFLTLILGCSSSGDDDGDGIKDGADNCPQISNPDQADIDSDGTGDECDALTDSDSDFISDEADNCPSEYNPNQTASIGNATVLGDACDDEDEDGVVDAMDNCPIVSNNDQADTDGNGLGDVCESCKALSLVADIIPGMDGSVPHPLAVLGDNLLFMVEYEEVWHHDESAGTTEMASFPPVVINDWGRRASAVMDGIWYFSGYDVAHSTELWMYDLVAGARVAADIVTGSTLSNPGSITAMDGKLYFSADDGVHGDELWAYDPANPSVGATMVADINPDGSSYPSSLTPLNGKLGFHADNDVLGSDWWIYDPATGASLMAEFAPGRRSPGLIDSVALNGKLYFIAQDEPDVPNARAGLWVFDPATPEAGTSLVYPGFEYIIYSEWPDDLIAIDDKLFFTEKVDGYGRELHFFDPANPAAGSQIAADSFPGMGSGRPPTDAWTPDDPLWTTELNGKLYFNASDGISGYELRVLDPADLSAGSRLAADINPGMESSFPVQLTAMNGKLYFRADDGVHGAEMWVYDPACQ